jgi:hypothetical protein
MPRRVGKNVFDITRTDQVDQPTHEPTPPLGSLLPRVRNVPTPAPAPARSPGAVGPVQKTLRGDSQAPEEEVQPRLATKTRGLGGRPSPENRKMGRITPVAARIPGPLYETALPLVKGVRKPSWGQLVTWTCQDHASAVRKEVTVLAQATTTPRRLRGQNREGEATMQVTARVLPDELAVLDDLRETLNVVVDPLVTRTMVIIAALTVATRQQ